MSNSEKNTAIVQRVYDEGINKGNLDVFDELVASDVVEHEEMPGFASNRDGVKQFFAMLRNAFPDLHFHVEDIFATEDRVVARLTFEGTHKGDFIGMAPTDRKIRVQAIDIFRVTDGKVAEHWGLTDTMTLMQQLGAVPPGA